MASGLVKRVVDRGDIFLVIENTVYVANVSWSGIWQEVCRCTQSAQMVLLGGWGDLQGGVGGRGRGGGAGNGERGLWSIDARVLFHVVGDT